MKPDSSSTRALFAACLALPTRSDRQAYLDKIAEHSPELVQEVLNLLHAHDQTEAGEASMVNPHGKDGVVGKDNNTVPAGGSFTEGSQIGRYKLLQRIGEGGMGDVWMAEQREPVVRKVALKIIKPGMDTNEVIARFEAERQALAVMDHPHIARVLDGGATEHGRPYFVMELVQGVPITEYANQAKLETRERLGLFLQVCEAVQHAHLKGIIHRDIKPNNIVVANHDGSAFAKVIDFGIAKATSQRLTERTLFTHYGQMIGTPAYMSPEQAQFSVEDVDTRADIYSLGCLLYELLTGAPPFESQELSEMAFDEMCRVIREQDPPKPSTKLSTMGQKSVTVAMQHNTDARGLDREVRGELDWIVMKSLDKDRNRRYQTAAAFAEDVRRHLDDEPVEANPPSLGYRVGKFTRKHGGGIAAVCAILTVLITGLTVSLWQTNAAVAAKRAESEQRELAQANAEREQELAETRRQELHAAQVDLAHEAWLDGDLERAQTLLESLRPTGDEEDLRSFGWRYLWLLCQDESQRYLESFPDDVSGPHLMSISADGRTVAVARGNVVKLWEVASGRPIRAPKIDAEEVTALAFSPKDPGLLAMGDSDRDSNHTIKLWDLTTDVPPSTIADRARINGLAFSRDGRLLATANNDGTIQLRDVETGALIRSMKGHEEAGKSTWALCVAFSPDGRFVASGGGDTHVRVWDAKTGDQIGPPLENGHTAWVLSLTFSPDGRFLASGGNDGRICLWDGDIGTTKRGAARRLLGHRGNIQAVAFSPDSKTLLSGGGDHTIRSWSVLDTQQPDVFRGHTGSVKSVLFTPDAQWIVSASRKAVKLWDVNARKNRDVLSDYEGWVEGVAVSPDGTTIASGDFHYDTHAALILWDVATKTRKGKPLSPLTPDAGRGIVFSPDGRFLASKDRRDKHYMVRLWDLKTLGKSTDYLCDFGAKSIIFLSDGKVMGAAGSGLQFWDVDSGREIDLLKGELQSIKRAAFAAEANLLVTASVDGTVKRWDTNNGTESPLARIEGNPESLAVSVGGTHLAVGCDDGTIALVDCARGEIVHRFPAHSRSVGHLAFTPDSRTLASASGDGAVKLWNVATGKIALTFRHVGGVTGLSFSADGRLMATAGADGTVRLRQAASLAEADGGGESRDTSR